MAQDSSQVEFWATRYRNGVMPWEGGRMPAVARACFDNLPARARVLVPGCGSGADVPPLRERGFEVQAVDFSAEAIDLARGNWPQHADSFVLADFFAFVTEPFDCVFERAMLCALPPSRHRAYVERVAALLKPGGLLAGCFFLAETAGGPPFGLPWPQLQRLLADEFELERQQWLQDSLPVFRQQECWMEWRRR